MKKVLTALVATAALTIATSAMAGVVASKHNLSSTTSTSYKSNTTQVCVFCHTPHNANYTRALWNRSAPTATFALYTSGANVETDSWYVGSSRTLPVDSPSILCMSCHDGSTSLVTLGKAPIEGSGHMTNLNIAFGNTLTGNAALGSNLTNDHPISIVYDVAVASTGS